jgi:ribosomal protein L13
MKVTDWVRRVLPVQRRRRECLRQCKVLTGSRHPENPLFSYCPKHDVWMLAL